MNAANAPRGLLLGLAAALSLTVIAYWPSLPGTFVLDDFNNIVYNPDLHLQSLDWASLRNAAMASPSSVLVRPLAMLSLGIDWYFGGGNPLPMRAVNIAIHLLNSVLLFGMLRALCRSVPTRAEGAAFRTDWLPLAVTAAWLLAPINFTAVAYIIQRMESLCQVFVLAGLWGYVTARRHMLAGETGFLWALTSILLGTAIGGLAKESAALLPLYALLVEWLVFGFAARDGKIDRRIVSMYLIVLALPACLALYWIVGHALPASAWEIRSFTLGERLLTEPRVLWDYIHWSLLPTPRALSLFHDDVHASRGLLDPATSLLAIIGLCTLVAATFMLRHRQPLFTLGTAWFLAAHLLTATVIPLELVFEHRNYFASIGLYLALFAVVLPSGHARLPAVRIAICAVLPLFFASMTFARSIDWGSPLRFALSETQKNPLSPRAAYHLAQVYVALTDYKSESPAVPEATAALEHAATLPGADALPDQALLVFSARLGRGSPTSVWQRMRDKLASQPLSVQNLTALYALNTCVQSGNCDFPHEQMVNTFLAALARTPPDTTVLTIYSNYALRTLHDVTLATDLARDAVTTRPTYMKMRVNLLALLAATGQHEEARAFYDQTLRELPQARTDVQFRAALDTPVTPTPASVLGQ